MNQLIVIALVAINISHGFRFMPDHKSGNEEWAAFKDKYNKTYKSELDEKIRKEIWMNNLARNYLTNYQNYKGIGSYILGINEFSDQEYQEFRRTRFGFNMENATRRGATFLAPHNTNLPQSVDWRRHGYVTPVKNQAQCGSCWAFSATGSLEGQHFRKTGKLVSLSEQNLVDCSGNFGNNGCDGGVMDNAFRYIKANGGIDTEKSYPYEAKDGKCRYKMINSGAEDTGYVDIAKGDEEQLKIAVATVGPISVAINAAGYNFQAYERGIYDPYECNPNYLNHGVLVVGYGTDNGKDYWLVKNSWGPKWGLNGYIKMARNHGNLCGIASMASYPLV